MKRIPVLALAGVLLLFPLSCTNRRIISLASSSSYSSPDFPSGSSKSDSSFSGSSTSNSFSSTSTSDIDLDMEKGFSVSAGLPDEDGNVTTIALLALYRNYFMDKTYGSNVDSLIDFLQDYDIVSILNRGQVTLETLGRIEEDLMKKEDYYNPFHSAEQLSVLLKDTDRDQFAAIYCVENIVDLFYDSRSRGTTSYRQTTPWGFDSLSDLDRLSEKSGDAGAFFRNLKERSEFGDGETTIDKADFYDVGLGFFEGRFYYEFYSRSLEILSMEQFQVLLDSGIFSTYWDSFLKSKDAVTYFHRLGKLLNSDFMDSDSFATYLGLLQKNYSFRQNGADAYLGNGNLKGLSRLLCFAPSVEEGLSWCEENADRIYDGIKFLAVFLQSLTPGSLSTLNDFLSKYDRLYQNVAIANESVSMAKVVEKAFSIFPEHDSRFREGFSAFLYWFSLSKSLNHHFIQDDNNSYNDSSLGSSIRLSSFLSTCSLSEIEKVIESIPKWSTWTPYEMDDSQKNEIESAIKGNDSHYVNGDLFVKAFYQVGEEPDIGYSYSGSEKIPADDVEGFTTAYPHAGIATFEYQGFKILFNYTVTGLRPPPRAEIRGGIDTDFVLKDSTEEDYRFTLSDDGTIVDFDTSTLGLHNLVIQDGEEYYASDYYVYDENSIETLFDFGTYYQGAISSRRFDAKAKYRIRLEDGTKTDWIDGSNGSFKMSLDFSTPGKKKLKGKLLLDGKLTQANYCYEVLPTVGSQSYGVNFSSPIELYQDSGKFLKGNLCLYRFPIQSEDGWISYSSFYLKTFFTLEDGTNAEETLDLYDSYYGYDEVTVDQEVYLKDFDIQTKEKGTFLDSTKPIVNLPIYDNKGNIQEYQKIPFGLEYEILPEKILSIENDGGNTLEFLPDGTLLGHDDDSGIYFDYTLHTSKGYDNMSSFILISDLIKYIKDFSLGEHTVTIPLDDSYYTFEVEIPYRVVESANTN